MKKGAATRTQDRIARIWTSLAGSLLLVVGIALTFPNSALALDPKRPLSQLDHVRWTRGDGAPTPINDITQDQRGFLWLAGPEGLFRFDGVRFERISSVEAGGATKVLAARDGTIWTWFGQTDTFGVYAGGKLRAITPPRLGTGRSQIIELMQTADGAIWSARGQTGYPLLRYKDGRWTKYGAESGLPRQQVMDVVAGEDGSLWVAVVGAVVRMAPGATRFTEVISSPERRGALTKDRQGRIWYSEQRGSYVIGDARGVTKPVDPRFWYPTDSSQRRGGTLFDRDGNLWLTTRANGLQRLRAPGPSPTSATAPTAVEHFMARDGLSSDSLLGPPFEDREGNIWISGTRGLDRFRMIDFVVEPELTKPAAFGDILWVTGDGTVYIAEASALYRVRPNQPPVRVPVDIHEPEAMCDDRKGTLVLADAATIFKIRGDAVERLPRPPHAETGLYDCTVDDAGAITVSAARDGMYRWDKGRWSTILADLAVQKLYPNNMIRERSGATVVAWNNDSVGRISPAGQHQLLMARTSTTGESYPLYEGLTGLIVADNRGLALGRRGGFARLGPDRVPEASRITGIVQTARGETWWQGGRGIVRVSTPDFERAFADPRYVPPIKVFGYDQGVPDSEAADSWRSVVAGADGRLWFAIATGTIWIDPAKLRMNPFPPGVAITSLVAKGKRTLDPATVTLAPGIADFELSFAGLSLSMPQRVQFRYRLIGYDQEWKSAGTRRQAFYTNLRPGHYRFEVIAINEDGVASKQAASADIVVQATFLQSWTFLGLCVLAGAVLLWLFYRVRLRIASRQLASRYEERLAERERIARELHDTLLQALQGLILKFRAVADRLPIGGEERDRLRGVVTQANAVMVDGRQRVHDLRTPPSSLEAALDEQVRLAATSSSQAIETIVRGPSQALRPEVTAELAAIATEALTNAIAHAGASIVKIRVIYRRRGISMEIEDDGVGFTPAILSGQIENGHYGLVGIRERAARLGATLSLQNAGAGGALVRITLPGWRAFAQDSWLNFLTLGRNEEND